MKRLFHIAAILLFATGSAAADVIRLRDSVRRTANDQPVLLRDIAILEGSVAEGFGGLVIRAEADDDVVRIRVDEIRDLLDDAGAYWGELSLEGGTTRVRPPAVRRGVASSDLAVQSSPRPMTKTDGAGRASIDLRTPFELLDRGGLAEEIAERVIEAWGSDSESIRIGLDSARLADAVAGLATAEISVQGNLRGDRFQVRIGGNRVDGRASRTRLLPVEIRIVETVPVAARELRPGRRLDASDFTLEPRPVRPSSVVLDLDSIEDRQLQTAVSRGQALEVAHLRPEIVVDRRDDVLVMADDGQVSIHVRGIAIEKGRVGDTIQCRLRTSDPRDRTAWFDAEVVGPGRVRLPRN
ncbi:MAG: flagellar basal body P-ring formation protein FlgA [Phycisphaeraceae bacterium]|nr:flagellar basal body P-ring formation protein FlgA [Phycisphaeraceae bacterium]